jgi:heat shock protein HslJ
MGVRRAAAAAALTLVWASSGYSAAGSEPDVDVLGTWALVSGSTADGPLAITPYTRVTLSFVDDRVGGKAPCNDYGSEYDVTGSSFALVGEGISTTLMGCGEEPEELESAYLAALGEVDTVARADERLTLTGAGTVLELRLEPPWPRAKVVGRTWWARSWTDDSGKTRRATWKRGQRPFVRFDESGPNGGRFSASNGCLTTTGRWREWNGAPAITRATAAGDCGVEPTKQQIALGSVTGEPVLSLRGTRGRRVLVVRYAHANSPARLVYRR